MTDQDTAIRMTTFEHVERLSEVYDHLTAAELKPGFMFNGERIPFINPQRGIYKPRQMRFLLLIKTVFPRPGGEVWYDDRVSGFKPSLTLTLKADHCERRAAQLLETRNLKPEI